MLVHLQGGDTLDEILQRVGSSRGESASAVARGVTPATYHWATYLHLLELYLLGDEEKGEVAFEGAQGKDLGSIAKASDAEL